jgi:hypothetical protein
MKKSWRKKIYGLWMKKNLKSMMNWKNNWFTKKWKWINNLLFAQNLILKKKNFRFSKLSKFSKETTKFKINNKQKESILNLIDENQTVFSILKLKFNI